MVKAVEYANSAMNICAWGITCLGLGSRSDMKCDMCLASPFKFILILTPVRLVGTYD